MRAGPHESGKSPLRAKCQIEWSTRLNWERLPCARMDQAAFEVVDVQPVRSGPDKPPMWKAPPAQGLGNTVQFGDELRWSTALTKGCLRNRNHSRHTHSCHHRHWRLHHNCSLRDLCNRPPESGCHHSRSHPRHSHRSRLLPWLTHRNCRPGCPCSRNFFRIANAIVIHIRIACSAAFPEDVQVLATAVIRIGRNQKCNSGDLCIRAPPRGVHLPHHHRPHCH